MKSPALEAFDREPVGERTRIALAPLGTMPAWLRAGGRKQRGGLNRMLLVAELQPLEVLGGLAVLMLGVLAWGGAIWMRRRRSRRRLASITEKVKWASIVEEHERRKGLADLPDPVDFSAPVPARADRHASAARR
jgi:hypothetical protein